MSHNTDRTLFQVDENIGSAAEAVALPSLKTWVTPKVITGTLSDDTSSDAAASADGPGHAS
jgi:hypothetical protein